MKSREEMASSIAEIRGRIDAAARRSGRTGDDITLVAVSKFHTVEEIKDAIACGIEILGENRVQERASKAEEWSGPDAEWHLIGHLQKNKARRAVKLFSCVQSIDGAEIASAVDRAASELCGGRPLRVLAEINTSGEASKTGADARTWLDLVMHIVRECPHLALDGLMTMGPLGGSESEVRGAFASLREMASRARSETGLALKTLSMGMSGDYEQAIEEGSTMVRIGTSIFGERTY